MVLLAAMIVSSGCIKMVQKNTEPAPVETVVPLNTTGMNVTSSLPGPDVGSLQLVPVAKMTPAKSEAVIEVAPFLTPNPYPVIHGVNINATPQYNRLDRNAEFEKTYSLKGNAIGLLVNVVQGPLYIVYTVTPKYDCLKSPESCRGNMKTPATRPYMTIIVRDNETHEIVADGGYAREYSSDTGRYEFIIESKNADDTTTTSTTTPGPRYLAIYKEGTYQVTIEGNYLDMNVKILTGAMPTRLDIGNGDTSAQESVSPDDEWS
ncbi:MAG: hypothetical protein Q7T80_13185 [Methanoregula sp.]|nr:hypothetical protein [Methanoregula sp.]